MSLFATLNTSISGMAAQATKLSTIGDNIANASTTGYKRAGTEFETLLGNEATSNYESGGVKSVIRYGVTDQGLIASTSSATDLAIYGNGFFVVQDSAGGTALTRAGSFVPDASGNLVNTAGYKLMGYSLDWTAPQPRRCPSSTSAARRWRPRPRTPARSRSTCRRPRPRWRRRPCRRPTPAARPTPTKTSLTPTTISARGEPRRLPDQDRRQHLGGGGLQPGRRRRSGGGFPYSSGPMATQTLTLRPNHRQPDERHRRCRSRSRTATRSRST